MANPESANLRSGGGEEPSARSGNESRDVELGGQPGDAQVGGNPVEIQTERPGGSGGGNADTELETGQRTSAPELDGAGDQGPSSAPSQDGDGAARTLGEDSVAGGRGEGQRDGDMTHRERDSDDPPPLRSSEGASTTGCSPSLWPGVAPRSPSPARSGDAHVIDMPVRQSSKVEELDHFKLFSIARTTSNFSVDSGPGDQCRICQQHTEEPLMELGCQCRGELARAHKTCVDRWFGNKGTNKCEVCLNVATNVPAPASQPTPHFWVWRVGGGPYNGRGGRRATGVGPLRLTPLPVRPVLLMTLKRHPTVLVLWLLLFAFMAYLFVDVTDSASIGYAAMPIGFLFGVLVVLGLGTAARLVLECWHERAIRRSIRRMEEEHNFEDLPDEQANNTNNNNAVASSPREGQPPSNCVTTPQPAAAVPAGTAEASHPEAVVENGACP